MIVYQKSHSPLALGACQLSFGLFLLMPAWYLAFRSDLAIALLNALYAFIKPRSVYEPVRPLFKRTSWKALTRSKRIILAVIAIVLLGLGLWLIIQGYPILSRLALRNIQ